MRAKAKELLSLVEFNKYGKKPVEKPAQPVGVDEAPLYVFDLDEFVLRGDSEVVADCGERGKRLSARFFIGYSFNLHLHIDVPLIRAHTFNICDTVSPKFLREWLMSTKTIHVSDSFLASFRDAFGASVLVKGNIKEFMELMEHIIK